MNAHWENIKSCGGLASQLSVRRYEGANLCSQPPVVLYLRGGSFLQPGLEPDGNCPELPVARALAESGAVVVEADYSKRPATSFRWLSTVLTRRSII